MTTTKRRKKQKSATIAFSLLCVFCLGLLGFGIWLFFQEGIFGGNTDGIPKTFQVAGLDPAAKTGALPGTSSRERPSGDNLFSYRIETAPVFTAAGKGKINVENPSFNKYLLVLEIARADDPSLLYQSQYIAPNQYIEGISLSAPLHPGNYDAVAYLNLVDPKTMRVADILEQPLKLSVNQK